MRSQSVFLISLRGLAILIYLHLKTPKNTGQVGKKLENMEQTNFRHRKKMNNLKFEELQNIVTIASTGNYGDRGVQNTGTI